MDKTTGKPEKNYETFWEITQTNRGLGHHICEIWHFADFLDWRMTGNEQFLELSHKRLHHVTFVYLLAVLAKKKLKRILILKIT